MSSPSPAVYVEGVAFWASRLPGWDIARAVIRGEAEPPATASPRPVPTLLAATERRRAPDTVAVALEVASRACEAAKRMPNELPAVFASTHGDLGINDYMCATLASTPTLISPIKFHNSVHNAAAGYWSIGTSSYEPYTAIAAYRYTFAAGLLEAATQAICEERAVLYVAFDVEAKGPLAQMAPSTGLLGVALVVSPVRSERGTHRLALRVQSNDAAQVTAAGSPAAALVAANVLAPCMPLVEALAGEETSQVSLALSEFARLHVGIEPCPR